MKTLALLCGLFLGYSAIRSFFFRESPATWTSTDGRIWRWTQAGPN